VFPLTLGILFVGYVLVYAATANKGRLAARPWDALREDAYA
jgi:hypothetical protein